MKRNILIVLSCLISLFAQAAVPMEIWTPRVHNPAFAEPGGVITVEMKGTQNLSAKGWKASVQNDLKAWPCVVKKATWGKIHHGTENGWTLTVSLPAKISPELMALEISNGSDKAVSVRAVNIVPDFKQDFYILHQSDQHIAEDQAVEPGGKSSKRWGVGSKDALQWMTPVVNLINPRFLMQTGDNMHLYFEYNYWCGMDTARQRVQRFLDGLSGLTVPFVLSTGNHDIGWKNYILVKEWRKEYTERLMGQRAFSFRMGSFYVLNTEWTVEEDFLNWAKADYAKAKADPSVKFRLQMAHFYNGPEGTPTVTSTGDSSDLMLVGHNHQTRTLQTAPYYVLSVGTAQDHQRAAFYNFHHTAGSWTSEQVKTHANGVNVHHLVGDNGTPKVAATYDTPNDGNASSNSVHIKNELPHDFYDGRIRFLLKRGEYKVTGGTILSQYDYNDGKNTAVVVKVNILNNTTTTLGVQSTGAFTIAYGSCNKTTEAQPLWAPIMKDQPDLWIWLGDNIYGDSNDTAVLRAKYNAQLAEEGYKALLAKVPVIGTWDDHDYGKNDGNKTYPVRKESQQIALDFLGEAKNSARRKQEGIYTSYTYKAGKKTIKVILLDVRYNQDPIQRDGKGYIPNPTADILGEVQWKWLKAQLMNSKADAHIIGSGLQFMPNEHKTEMWANFPTSLQRFYKLLADSKAKGVMLITGDRHIGEFTKKDIPGIPYPLYEFTSSGMTHSSVNDTLNKNSFRVGALVTKKNYGLFRFEDKGKTLEVEATLKGEDGVIFTTEKISY